MTYKLAILNIVVGGTGGTCAITSSAINWAAVSTNIWVSSTTTTTWETYCNQAAVLHNRRNMTPEQEASERLRRQAEEARYREDQEARTKAINTAQELFMMHLTEEQRRQVRDKGWFIVEGGKSKKKFAIETRSCRVHGNIYELNEEKKIVANYCFQLKDYNIPVGDVFLAQKLFLEHDEEETMKIANRAVYNTPYPINRFLAA